LICVDPRPSTADLPRPTFQLLLLNLPRRCPKYSVTSISPRLPSSFCPDLRP
jgi:hypothetical protein